MLGTWQGGSAAENDSNSRKFVVDPVTSPMAPVQHIFFIYHGNDMYCSLSLSSPCSTGVLDREPHA